MPPKNAVVGYRDNFWQILSVQYYINPCLSASKASTLTVNLTFNMKCLGTINN